MVNSALTRKLQRILHTHCRTPHSLVLAEKYPMSNNYCLLNNDLLGAKCHKTNISMALTMQSHHGNLEEHL
jgi:hypothetical protein